MREKLTTGTTTYEEKVQKFKNSHAWILDNKESSFLLGVSEYQVRQARDLKKSRGILAMLDKNRGKTLPESTAEKVILFFEE